ncbi:PadR family transcriptional regulator [Anaeromicropila herbilytica]|uniref:PadR family transcriptional regulator n=1 Tax=Anaeromicropila herbilytica TaxID=2785025 RepID=A0A7R7EJY8_9FIRM|nr:PadR family transcriptional regulator [Anaeromicropila herbilytica]BCN30195.1 PadR family transcriptional regulator [Anaeromicropila herbilytica]
MEESQLLKGILESCILAIIAKGETYGYDILSTLESKGFDNIGEGTLYPVLTRLEKKEYILCRIGSSPYGPKRKYYTITALGSKQLVQAIENYKKITHTANLILFEEDT